jgi:hypothetical protein
MRKLLLLAGTSLVLAGCITNERGELIGRSEFYRTAEKAQSLGLLTPAIAEECSAHIVKMFTKPPKFLGPFSISTHTAIRNADYKITVLPDHSADNTIAVSAPVNSFGPFGEVKTMTGCLYRLEDNRLVFEKAKIFGQRIDITRVAPAQVQRQKSE